MNMGGIFGATKARISSIRQWLRDWVGEFLHSKPSESVKQLYYGLSLLGLFIAIGTAATIFVGKNWMVQPDVVAQQRAQQARDDADWQRVLQSPNVVELARYLSNWPNGKHSLEAQRVLSALFRAQNLNADEDDAAWMHAKRRNLISAFQEYLEKFKYGLHVREAHASIEAIRALWKARTCKEIRDTFPREGTLAYREIVCVVHRTQCPGGLLEIVGGNNMEPDGRPVRGPKRLEYCVKN